MGLALDEVVFCCEDDGLNEVVDGIMELMNRCAEVSLMQYGVKGECSPAVGQTWLKD